MAGTGNDAAMTDPHTPDTEPDLDDDGWDSDGLDSPLARALPAVAREVEEFVGASGWGQPTQLFALVPTAALLASRPELAGEIGDAAALTPVAQDELPAGQLDEALAAIEWPDTVAGCAIAQEIVVLPPGVGDELDDLPADSEQLREAAAAHPERQEGRLVAAVLRDGEGACLIRVRLPDDAPDDMPELVENPQLAPNLLRALLATLS